MTTSDQSHQDIETLRNLVGDQVFARGQACFAGGHVTLIAVGPERVEAHVEGLNIHFTELSGRGADLAGKCGCSEGMQGKGCEHIVAVALAVNAAGRERMTDMVGNVVSIFARQKNTAALPGVEKVAPRARRPSGPALQGDDDAVEAQLRNAIDEATRVEHVVNRRAVEKWANDILAVFDNIRPMARTKRAAIAVRLIDYAIDRVEQAAKAINDPDNCCGKLFDRSRTIHLNAAKKLRPDPMHLARVLFEREHVSGCWAFRDVLQSYEELLGETGLAEYRRLAEEAWSALRPIPPNQKGDPPLFRYNSLRESLDYIAERDGDVGARIALCTKDLSSGWHYERLIDLCSKLGRKDLAVKWGEEGVRALPGDARLAKWVATLLVECGRKEQAEAHLRTALETAQITSAVMSSWEIYSLCLSWLRLCGPSTGDEIIAKIEQRISNASRDSKSGWADILLDFLLHLGRLDEAFVAARRFEGTWQTRRKVARLLEPIDRSKASVLYVDIVWQLVPSERFSSMAMMLIDRLGVLHERHEHLAFLDDLKQRFARKKSFMTQLGFHDAKYRAGTFEPLLWTP